MMAKQLLSMRVNRNDGHYNKLVNYISVRYNFWNLCKMDILLMHLLILTVSDLNLFDILLSKLNTLNKASKTSMKVLFIVI